MLSKQQTEILKKPNFAHLATVDPDGTPQVTPVWVDVDEEDGVILVNTAEGRRKVHNIRRNPRVGIDVVDQDNPYEMVSIKGQVVEITADGADEHINAMAKKYLGKDEYPFRQPGEERIKVRISPEKVSYGQ